MRLPGTRLRFDLAGQIVERGFPHSNCMRPGLDAPFAQHGIREYPDLHVSARWSH
jgi:hypothetical protein